MAERLSVEQDVVGSSPTSLPFVFKSPNLCVILDFCILRTEVQMSKVKKFMRLFELF